MITKRLISTLIIVTFLSINAVNSASDSMHVKSDALSAIELPVPQNPDVRSYLGISEDNSFTIPQIKAEVVIIEIFSMYCPYCQREAPKVNKLYWAIEADRNLKGKIKMIGIGAGNSPFEVEVFRKKYQVPFPLFPDEDFSIHKACGKVRTPYFLGVKIKTDSSVEVFYNRLGGIQDPSQFLELILHSSGIKDS